MLEQATGPIHLVGHSYGGAIAFKIATTRSLASHPQPDADRADAADAIGGERADRRLHDHFADARAQVSHDLWKGSVLEAIDKFAEFWRGSGPREELSQAARIRMIEHAERLAFDFMAAFAEENVTIAAAALRVPTLLFSGGHSPNMTQRIVQPARRDHRGRQVRHLPDAGHMLAMTHAPLINPEIAAHLALDELAGVPLAADGAGRGSDYGCCRRFSGRLCRLARQSGIWYPCPRKTGRNGKQTPMTARD